jgi:hypothetical protein
MDIEALAARLQRLEDLEEIKRLKATYCELCDAGLDDERTRRELISRFTAEAKVDFGLGPASRFEGHDGLEEFFGRVVASTLSFSKHMLHNPIIDVDGDHARGRWYFEAPTTDRASGRAQWMVGVYLEEYARVAGEWKFASIRTRWDYISPYDEGWAKNRGELLEKLGGRS